MRRSLPRDGSSRGARASPSPRLQASEDSMTRSSPRTQAGIGIALPARRGPPACRDDLRVKVGALGRVHARAPKTGSDGAELRRPRGRRRAGRRRASDGRTRNGTDSMRIRQGSIDDPRRPPRRCRVQAHRARTEVASRLADLPHVIPSTPRILAGSQSRIRRGDAEVEVGLLRLTDSAARRLAATDSTQSRRSFRPARGRTRPAIGPGSCASPPGAPRPPRRADERRATAARRSIPGDHRRRRPRKSGGVVLIARS